MYLLENPKNHVVNYIPREAILISEEARLPEKSERDLAESEKAAQIAKKDPYNEDKISKTEPSAQDVESSPPDDTVRPG